MARCCTNDYWQNLCKNIQHYVDSGNLYGMYEGMKVAFGPYINKVVPMKFRLERSSMTASNWWGSGHSRRPVLHRKQHLWHCPWQHFCSAHHGRIIPISNTGWTKKGHRFPYSRQCIREGWYSSRGNPVLDTGTPMTSSQPSLPMLG